MCGFWAEPGQQYHVAVVDRRVLSDLLTNMSVHTCITVSQEGNCCDYEYVYGYITK